MKALSILWTGYQPPLVYELGVPLYGGALMALAWRERRSWLTWTARLAVSIAVVAGLVAFGSEVAGALWGAAIALAMVAVVMGSILIGVVSRSGGQAHQRASGLALVIGLATVPALAVGGLLSMASERLLEVPVLFLGGAWMWLGMTMLFASSKGT